MMRDHLKANEAAEVEYKGDTPREMNEKSSFIHSERDSDLPLGFGRGGVSVATTKKTQTFFSWKHQCILLGIVVCVIHFKAARDLSAQYKAFFSPPPSQMGTTGTVFAWKTIPANHHDEKPRYSKRLRPSAVAKQNSTSTLMDYPRLVVSPGRKNDDYRSKDSLGTATSRMIALWPQFAPIESFAGNIDNENLSSSHAHPTIGKTDESDQNEDSEGEMRIWPNDEIDPNCKPAHKWQSLQFPVCNLVHEFYLGESMADGTASLLKTNGFWRNVWTNQASTEQSTTVWKTFKLQHNMEDAFFENSRVDALAMERLTASSGVINMFAFCAMTVVQEFAGKGLSSLPSSMDPEEKLVIATKIAKAVVDIHSIDGEQQPSLVHNDINLANVLLTPDDRPVLNDFNIAVLLKRHSVSGQMCPFVARFPNPQWRSPEEQIYKYEEEQNIFPTVNEKVDVYGLGNILYRLLVGKTPWKREGLRFDATRKAEVAHLKRRNGTIPLIPLEIQKSSNTSIVTMRNAMYQCFRFHPDERPPAHEIYEILRRKSSR